MHKRPLPVTILSWLYMATGIAGLAVHAKELSARSAFQPDAIWIVLLPLLAIVAGVYMLRAHNWARWLALSWIAFHVVISAFDSLQKLMVHVILLALFAYFLFRPEATTYFRLREHRTA
jgi:hypothetical protein